jgi:hypothetical protein
MKRCNGLVELLKSERPDLKEEIIRHKYFKSGEQGKDVGLDWATDDFIHHHLDLWAEGYKVAYCKHICPYRKECER